MACNLHTLSHCTLSSCMSYQSSIDCTREVQRERTTSSLKQQRGNRSLPIRRLI